MISKGAMNGWFVQALKQQLEWLQKKKGADIKVLLRAGKQTHQNCSNSKQCQAELLEERRQWILDYCQDEWMVGSPPSAFCCPANRQDPENGKEFPEKCLSQG